MIYDKILTLKFDLSVKTTLLEIIMLHIAENFNLCTICCMKLI